MFSKEMKHLEKFELTDLLDCIQYAWKHSKDAMFATNFLDCIT